MSIFAKNNQLSNKLDSKHGNIFLTTFSILCESSNINVKYSTITNNIRNRNIPNIVPVFTINNSNVNILNTNIDETQNKFIGNISIKNSKQYIDNPTYKNYTYVEKGSIFNYPDISLAGDVFFNTFAKDTELIIPFDDLYSKEDYVTKNHLENLGTGNKHYSTHFLNSSNYGYWGNKFGGEFIEDTTIETKANDILDILFTTLPRNLNGYKLTINVAKLNGQKIEIKNFYNGILNIVFNKESDEALITRYFEIKNNNLVLNITIKQKLHETSFNFQDNKDLNLIFEEELKDSSFSGNNNNVNITFKNNIKDLLLFDNSYGNKIIIDSINDDNNTVLFNCLKDINYKKGNYIFVKSIPSRIGKRINDSSQIDIDNNYIQNFTIDEVHPKKYRDVTDIGTIVGWPAHLPIPRGYYECNGEEVLVDLHNPNDEYYNGQLAFYLNNNLSNPKIKLPDIPSAKPTGRTNDLYYRKTSTGVANFVPVGKDGIKYIIKYNNNFENKKKG